jgi:hypothetical protein
MRMLSLITHMNYSFILDKVIKLKLSTEYENKGVSMTLKIDSVPYIELMC